MSEDAIHHERVCRQVTELMTELTDVTDPQSAYATIASRLAAMTESDYAFVMVYERGREELRVVGLAGLEFSQLADMPQIVVTPEVRARMLQGRRSQSVVAADEKDVPRGAVAVFKGLGLGSIASASIVFGGDLIGYLGVGRTRDRPPLTQVEAGNLRVLADCIAGVMDHIRTSLTLARTTKATDRILSVAPIGLMTVDSKGMITSLNKQMLRILAGESEDRFVGTNVLEIPAMAKSGLDSLVMQSFDGHAGEKNEVHFVPSPDKVFYLHVKVAPLLSDTAQVESALIVAMDVTSNIRLQSQLERSYEKLIQTYQELERVTKMKTQFLDIVSHELRTPLTVMRGYLDLVESEYDSGTDPKLAQKMKTIRANTDKLYSLVESMLDVSRLEKGTLQINPEPVKVDAVLADVVKARSHDAEEKKQAMSLNVEGEMPLIMADRRRIRDVFNSLVDNSVKYTEEGGKIQIGVRDEGRMIHVWVRDTGVGIPLENIGRIFDRFFIVAGNDLSHQVNRIGLSLPISKGIVEAHGGRIWVESQVGKGSVFHVSLPKESLR